MSDQLERPAFLGRPRFEDRPSVSERSVGSVGVLAVMVLIATAVSALSGYLTFAVVLLALFLLTAAAYAVLVRRLVQEQRAAEGRLR